jgi:hypothetical protein
MEKHMTHKVTTTLLVYNHSMTLSLTDLPHELFFVFSGFTKGLHTLPLVCKTFTKKNTCPQLLDPESLIIGGHLSLLQLLYSYNPFTLNTSYCGFAAKHGAPRGVKMAERERL